MSYQQELQQRWSGAPIGGQNTNSSSTANTTQLLSWQPAIQVVPPPEREGRENLELQTQIVCSSPYNNNYRRANPGISDRDSSDDKTWL